MMTNNLCLFVLITNILTVSSLVFAHPLLLSQQHNKTTTKLTPNSLLSQESDALEWYNQGVDKINEGDYQGALTD
ncbi:MAG: hypothetical protein ACP8RL_04645, partial [cyanobacterium endosymbiont of Rhopalodia inflata]